VKHDEDDNNDKRPEPDVSGRQLTAEFWNVLG
jgi:hypothetical protein